MRQKVSGEFDSLGAHSLKFWKNDGITKEGRDEGNRDYRIDTGDFAAAVLAEVWRELHCFKITRYRIRTSKIKGDAGKVRIAFLSDLHNHVYGKENEELLLAIREAKPDLILAGGDMLVGKAGRDWTPAAD